MALHTKKALSAAALVRFTAFEQAGDDEVVSIVLPDDLTTLSAEDIAKFRGEAVAAYKALRGQEGLSADKLQVLSGLKDMVAALDAEKASRAKADADLEAQLAALDADMTDEPVKVEEAAAEVVAEAEAVVEQAAEQTEVKEEALVASGSAPQFPRSISIPGLKARQTKVEAPKDEAPKATIKAALGLDAFAAGASLTLDEMADAFAEMTEAARPGPVQAARRSNARFSQKHKVAFIEKPFDPRAVVDERGDADAAMAFAVDESRLTGGSLVAAGGWCAPSETLYDLYADETRDGLISLPEVQVRRGGLRWTLGPDWADIFANTGFCFTEADDEAGNYDGASSGTSPKPTDIVPCPSFTEQRLDVCGVTIQSGILLNRAYPEVVKRYVSGALIAHDHRVATNVINDMIAGSTAVTPTALTNGTGVIAPILHAIELQVEDMKYRRRLARNATIEAVFPYWVRGAIRADLSRRMGVDLLQVTDAQIDAMFRLRGINAQFVYNFDNLGASSAALVWPTTVRFLLYPAGTWVKGSSDLITLSMLHDSTLNENNNFTAIFTEEGWMVMKKKHDSRIVTVAICANGNTHTGLAIAC